MFDLSTSSIPNSYMFSVHWPKLRWQYVENVSLSNGAGMVEQRDVKISLDLYPYW